MSKIVFNCNNMKKWHICLMFPISSDMLHSHLLIKVFQSVHGNKSMIYFSFNFFFSIFLKVNQFSSRFTLALAVLWTLTLMITNVLLLWEPVLECPKDLLSKKPKVSYFVHMYLIFSLLWIWKKNPWVILIPQLIHDWVLHCFIRIYFLS